MASPELSRRVKRVVGYPPLSEMSDGQRREPPEAEVEGSNPSGRVPRQPVLRAATPPRAAPHGRPERGPAYGYSRTFLS